MNDLAPGLKTRLHLSLDGCPGGLALLCANLLVEPHAEQLHLHPLDFARLRGGNGGQETGGAVERPIRVVRTERPLVRPTVADLPQFADQGALRVAERLAEHVVPLVPHGHQDGGGIPLRFLWRSEQLKLRIRQRLLGLRKPVRSFRGLEFSLNKRLKPRRQEFQHLADAFVICDGHKLLLITHLYDGCKMLCQTVELLRDFLGNVF